MERELVALEMVGGGGIGGGGIGGGGIGSGGIGGGGIGGGGIGGGSVVETCPRPSPEAVRCLKQWACQEVLRLDLRCLLNINRHSLLGNLVKVPGITGGTAGGHGAHGAHGGGILSGLLTG
ncbi:PREDICTED: acanthoscurrin-1 [Drosophila arizonae]|uniref:Acanthoscurrin-1 n=1 Tax=Drosophila arizonae TaxID=7263 RepID=A0ABM1P066_DROAR|nr:PREDICTED: acanthoscurrin-1 [Drosophila arizonae]